VSSDITEDEDPSDNDIIDLSSVPGSGPVVTSRKTPHQEVTRRYLGFTVVVAMLVLEGYCVTALICGWIDRDTFTTIQTGLSGPAALAAAVIGFFYGRHGS
jgi:hypothetical protein